MGALDFLKSVFGSAAPSTGVTSRSCIVDVCALAGGTNAAPRQKIQMLQRLGRYASQEGVKVVAVLDGEELRAVVHGDAYQGVPVFYAERSGSLAAALLDAHKRDPDAVVVTDHKEAEGQVRGQGGSSMRASTFRKAIEAPGDPDSEGEDTGRNGGRRERRPQNRSRRGGRRDRRGGDREEDRGRGERSERNAPKEKDDSNRDSVSDLIDLVE